MVQNAFDRTEKKACLVQMKMMRKECFFSRVQKSTCAFFILATLLLLTGCVDYETYSLSLDLDNKTGVMTFLGLHSTSQSKDEIEADFQGLLKAVYPEKDDEKEKPDPFEILSSELSMADNTLNAKIVFRFKDKVDAKSLKELGIDIDTNGDYVVSGNPDEVYVRGNAVVTMQDSKQTLKWGKDSRKIEYELRNSGTKDKKITSLLPRWLEWKKQNKPQGQSH